MNHSTEDTISGITNRGSGLRIGLDAKRAFNNDSGLGNYSRFVINGLISHYPENEYYLFTPYIDPRFEHFFEEAGNIHVIAPESFLTKTFSAGWRSFSLTDLLIKHKLDVFHGLSNELPVGIERFTGHKIVTVHDLIFLRYPGYYNAIDRYIYKKKFRNACKKADLVIAASEQTKKDIVHYFNTAEQKIKVVYQDCDPRFGDKTDESSKEKISNLYKLPEKYILSVGTLEKRKNQLTILKAFHQLNDRDLKLMLVGRKTDYFNTLQSYILENKLSDRVLIIDRVHFAHLPAIYRMSEVFVYASEFEGFGIPVLEGMRSGVPVIAANTSSLTEVGGKGARYFQFDNDKELAHILREILDSQPLRADMITEGYKQAEKFNPDALLKQLINCYGNSE